MRRNLLRPNSFEESLHVTVVREEQGVGISVVRVLVTRTDAGDFVSIVAFSVFLHILRLLSIKSVEVSQILNVK